MGIFDINAMITHCPACSYASEGVTKSIVQTAETVTSNSNEYSR